MVTHQLQVERRTGKVRRPETDVLPLSHATNRRQRKSLATNFLLIGQDVLILPPLATSGQLSNLTTGGTDSEFRQETSLAIVLQQPISDTQ